ncbi:DUF1990 family protein [Pseudonocardia sp. MH-G8]|uniref:DUF1990 family protein n=1 Tax=Pseudonocardia sp. MH-G8 TaxID=1854588 RepID=UPI000B9FCA42|nr:DUF1990 family protein [Pseudonocardia sp. MH-G8]OZM80998.1 hypothetical protein CFP66_16440 [Pseudonocardia sp. MH-G8]
MHRVGIVLRWPLGLARVSWRYLWRVTAIHRSEADGAPADRPGPVPQAVLDGDVQRVEDGVGPLLRRRYAVRVVGATLSPAQVIGRFSGDPNCGAPSEVAVFEKVRGLDGELRVGDEFLIRMPGPWDGPVRVIDTGPASFRLATLRGHLEAGQIEFRCRAEDGELVFEIESWARSGDRLSNLLYTRLRLAKEIQLNLWVETCLRLARDVGGRARGGVRVETRRIPLPALTSMP